MVTLSLERVDCVQSRHGTGAAAVALDHRSARLAASLPDSAANPQSPSWQVPIFAGLFAARRARRAAAVERALRHGLAALE